LEVKVPGAGIDEEGINLIEVAGVDGDRERNLKARRRPIEVVGQQGHGVRERVVITIIIEPKIRPLVINGDIGPEEIVIEPCRVRGFVRSELKTKSTPLTGCITRERVVSEGGGRSPQIDAASGRVVVGGAGIARDVIAGEGGGGDTQIQATTVGQGVLGVLGVLGVGGGGIARDAVVGERGVGGLQIQAASVREGDGGDGGGGDIVRDAVVGEGGVGGLQI